MQLERLCCEMFKESEKLKRKYPCWVQRARFGGRGPRDAKLKPSAAALEMSFICPVRLSRRGFAGVEVVNKKTCFRKKEIEIFRRRELKGAGKIGYKFSFRGCRIDKRELCQVSPHTKIKERSGRNDRT